MFNFRSTFYFETLVLLSMPPFPHSIEAGSSCYHGRWRQHNLTWVNANVYVLSTVGDKIDRCPKLKVIDVSGTLAEVSHHILTNLQRWYSYIHTGYPENPQRGISVVPVQPRCIGASWQGNDIREFRLH